MSPNRTSVWNVFTIRFSRELPLFNFEHLDISLALSGVDAVQVVRTMAGVTNGREAAPGTIRGDYSMSNQQNIVHASDSVENAAIELRRFFREEEIFDYPSNAFGFVYGEGECK